MKNTSKLVDTLKVSVVEVTFTKLDGTERIMVCTQDFTKIPANKLPKQDSLPPPFTKNLIQVFDLSIGEWRSFYEDSVIEWKLTGN